MWVSLIIVHARGVFKLRIRTQLCGIFVCGRHFNLIIYFTIVYLGAATPSLLYMYRVSCGLHQKRWGGGGGCAAVTQKKKKHRTITRPFAQTYYLELKRHEQNGCRGWFLFDILYIYIWVDIFVCVYRHGNQPLSCCIAAMVCGVQCAGVVLWLMRASRTAVLGELTAMLSNVYNSVQKGYFNGSRVTLVRRRYIIQGDRICVSNSKLKINYFGSAYTIILFQSISYNSF